MSHQTIDTLEQMYADPMMKELRFGQWFINNFIKDEGNDENLRGLYNEKNYHICKLQIMRWLIDNSYGLEMPPKLR